MIKCRKCGNRLEEPCEFYSFTKDEIYIIDNNLNIKNKLLRSYFKYKYFTLLYNSDQKSINSRIIWYVFCSSDEKNRMGVRKRLSKTRLVSLCFYCGATLLIKDHSNLINKSKQDVKQNIVERLNIIKVNKAVKKQDR